MLAAKNNSLVSTVSTAIAFTILAFWLISLIFCFRLDVANLPWILIIAGMCLRTFLQTGIFIIIHDSIHGVVNQDRTTNCLIGYVAAFLYALLSYQTLAKNHHQHHLYPATENDPDFYLVNPHNYWRWYVSFMKDYQQGKQFWILFWGMTIIFCGLIGLHVAVANIFLFWVIPIIISSLQLFTFGIYLPHRPVAEEYGDRHRAKSSNYPAFWSFIACYHFGYHWEHHQYPHLPWYKLPSVRH
jgi:beta-carotene/zeaxanthin 4-ketolase